MKGYHATFDCRPFEKVGLTPSQITDIYNQVNLWIRSCGPEWTVSRLKDIKQLYVYKISGKEPEPIEWLSIDKDGNPKGPFKAIFKVSKKRGRRRTRRCIDALMVYTGIILKRVSRRQSEKFFNSVAAEPVDVKLPLRWGRAMDEINHFIKSNGVTFQRLTYRSFNLSGNKASLDAEGRSAPNTCERFVDDFRTTVMWDLLDDDDICDVLADSLSDLYYWLFKTVDEDVENDLVGRISILQEKGCKARFIAIPRLTIQLGLQSLGKYLLNCCGAIPWDCTHDQSNGLRWAKAQLKSGQRLWSVDVSDFTNHWPLELIENCLRRLCGDFEDGDLKLFHASATGKYKYHKTIVSWAKGQPLGVFPSFPAAALSHGAVLRAIEVECQVVDTFRVLGDDVIISDSRVYQMYREFLLQHHIPVSLNKTLEFADIGEFAGAIVTQYGYFVPRKVIIPKASNQLQVEAVSELPPSKAKTPKQFLGSLVAIAQGANPDGLSIDERRKLLYLILASPNESEDLVKEEKHLVGYMRQYYSLIKPERATVTVNRDWLMYWVGRTMARCRRIDETYSQVHACYLRAKALACSHFDSEALDRLEGELAKRVEPLTVMYRSWFKPHNTADPVKYYRWMACYTAAIAHAATTELPWKREQVVESYFMKKCLKMLSDRQTRIALSGRDLIRSEMLELSERVIDLLCK